MKISLELQPCCGQRSGIGLYTYELSKRLISDSDLSFKGNIFNFRNRNDNTSTLSGVNYPIQTNTIIPYGVYRRTWHYIPFSYESFFDDADLTHFFNFIVPPKINGKVINTIHDLIYMYYPETMDKKNLIRITRDIDYSINRSDIILVNSENTKLDLLKEYKLDSNKVKIVYPSSSLSPSSVVENEIRVKYNITTSYILYVGNLEPRKNIERLIQAYGKLKKETGINNQLVIAGGKSWSYENIFHTVAKLELENNIIFTGYTNAEEKTALYKYAHLFVYPALYEGFGMPILESLACNTPVVCSDTSSMPEVGGNAAYYINPLDILDIAEGMYKMLTDEKLRNKKMSFAQAQVTKFSWDKSAENLLEIYKSFLCI